MPAGPIGSVWATGSWADTAWEAGSWADAAGLPASPDVIVRVRGRHAEARSNEFTHHDGGMFLKDPSDTTIVQFDFDAEYLAAQAAISGAPVFTITAIRPLEDEELTKDDEAVITGDRQAQCRLTGGTLGAVYRLDCQITTNETPSHPVERSIFVKIEEM